MSLRTLWSQLPTPVVELCQRAEELIPLELVLKWLPFLSRLAEYTFFYLLCFFGFGYGWVVLLAILYFQHSWDVRRAFTSTILSRLSSERSEKDVLAEYLPAFPAWVNFPDFERVEWVNSVIGQLWAYVDPYSTYFVQTYIEPKIKEILDMLNLDKLSGLKIKRVVLGKIPLRLGGIKVYNVTREEVMLDCEAIYAGDARVQFTLQGMAAEINKIQFKGKARVTLKPLLHTFPFVGGFEVYLLNMPTLDYSLGGIGTFGDLPGVSKIIRSVVESQIRARFVWPNRMHFYLPMEEDMGILSVNNDDKSFLMRQPSGVLTVTLVEARDLVKKDKHVLGSGKSDPYAKVSVGERLFDFRSKYIAKTVNPKWDYVSTFLMEEWHGQLLNIEVFDYDAMDADDFLGRTHLELDTLLSGSNCTNSDQWVKLSDVKHGDIHLVHEWHVAKDATDEDKVADMYIVSLLVDHIEGLTSNKSVSLYPKCKIKLNSGDPSFCTTVASKTSNPVYEESFLIESFEPATDVLNMEVVDNKTKESLGKLTLAIQDIIDWPGKEFANQEFPLENLSSAEPKIKLSAKLYSVQRS